MVKYLGNRGVSLVSNGEVCFGKGGQVEVPRGLTRSGILVVVAEGVHVGQFFRLTVCRESDIGAIASGGVMKTSVSLFLLPKDH
mgnify:CR=1 FL=1